MRHILLGFGLLFGSAATAGAQAWQPPNAAFGSPVAIPTGPGRLTDDPQARIRAQNQAIIADEARRTTQRSQAIAELRQEASTGSPSQAATSAQFAAINKPQYEVAYQRLSDMLAGKQPPDLQQAVFLVENTYLAGQLRYTDFQAELHRLAVACLHMAGPKSTATQKFRALHQLVTDTLTIREAGAVSYQHLPFRYDFEDYQGERDYTKQFVTKLLATNSGQCHSLPLLYKLLADAIGVRAYLSLAPNHSYIQVKDDRGQLFSYETSNRHFVTDAYYMSTGFIKATALKRRTYLDTLTQQQTLATRVFDLAQCYDNRYGLDGFVLKCGLLGLHYYPHSAQGRMIVYNTVRAGFLTAWQAAGRPTREQARQTNPTLFGLWQEMDQARKAVEATGHEDMPPEQYAQWLRDMNQEQLRQSAQPAGQATPPPSPR